MPTTFKAILRGAGKTGSQSCTVLPTGGELEITLTDGSLIRMPYTDTTVSLTGVADRYIAFEAPHPEGLATLLVADGDIERQLIAVGAPRAFLDAVQTAVSVRKRRGVGRSGGVVIALVVLVLLGIGAWLGLGWATDRAVDLVPASWESTLGRNAAEQILAEASVCADPELDRVVNHIGTRLVGGLGRTDYRFTLRILDAPEVNAFALPGGYLFVNRGLIEQADDGFEVAGVLAHEIQHVLLRHGMQNLVRRAGLMLILRSTLGDAGALEQFLMVNAAELAAMSFNRDQERAADRAGVALMTRTGMDPRGLPRFLDKMAAQNGAAEHLAFLSSHPGSKERAEALRRLVASLEPPAIQPLRFPLSPVRGRCAPVRITDPDSR